MDVEAAAHTHCARFNTAVRTGDWTLFVATFSADARIAFTNVPAGPFNGRAAIAAGYAENPPDDTMTVVAVEPVGDDTARVRFMWDRGGPGTMLLRWRDREVADLEITFG